MGAYMGANREIHTSDIIIAGAKKDITFLPS